MTLLENLPLTAAAMAMAYLLLIIATIVQDLRPLERNHPSQDVLLTYVIGLFGWFALWAVSPLSSASAVLITNALGAGLIALPATSWMFLPSLLIYLAAQDLLEYAMHRAQHKVPFLWAMHSLHHSEEAYAARTATRHFWLEPVIKVAVCYPLLAVLFSVPVTIVWTAMLIYMINHIVAHMNVRLPIGRFSLWIQNPQFHRIHHSTQPKHFNKNFSDLFPMFDVVFGTAWKPAADEFPSTGLVPSDKPATVMESIIWPVRNILAGVRSRKPSLGSQ